MNQNSENDFNVALREISAQKYNVLIGIVLLWGFAINAVMCWFFTDMFMQWDVRMILVGYFVCAMIGIFLNVKSSNPVISFFGYNLVVLPVGVVLSVALSGYESVSIFNTFIITAVVTLVMLLLATIKPNVFLSMGQTLFACLFSVIVVEIIMSFLGIYKSTLMDLLVALLFCGYIGYDWAKAQKKHKTVDNAIDSACALYLDIINLFIRILSLTGKRRRSF